MASLLNILIKMESRSFFCRFQILIYVGNATDSRGTRKRKRWHISYTHFIQFVCRRLWHFAFSKWKKDDWIRVDTKSAGCNTRENIFPDVELEST